MPSMTKFCPACGKAREGRKPFCRGCGHNYAAPADAPPAIGNIAGAARQVASAAASAQSAVSSAASAVQGAGQLAALVLDGTPPPSWHVVVGETLPSVEEILARKAVQVIEQQVEAVGRKAVDRAVRHLEQAVAGPSGGGAPTAARPDPAAAHYCEKCGAAIGEESRFCLKCGQPHAHGPSSGPVPAPGPGPGATCPRCRAAVSPGWQFCKKCGLRMEISPTR